MRAPVEMVKEAEEELAGTVTEVGTINPASPAGVRETTAPPLGAAELNVTVQVEELALVRELTRHTSELKMVGETTATAPPVPVSE